MVAASGGGRRPTSSEGPESGCAEALAASARKREAAMKAWGSFMAARI
jgi:hypothetical protein